MQIDPAVPQNVVKQILATDGTGIHPSHWNDELKALFNPSISARPLHVPESGSIKTIKNKEYHYFLAFDRCGSNPRHERVEALRGTGDWDYATTDDVEMCSADNVKQKNEIRSGDRRLMKIPMRRWLEIRKSQILAGLDQINPRRANSGPMSVESMTPGMASYAGDDESIRASARVSDPSEELRTGQITGNAAIARIPKEK